MSTLITSVIALKGTPAGGFRLTYDLSLSVLESDGMAFAIPSCAVREYGNGDTPREAIDDCLQSLGEYRRVLECREGHLAEIERRELAALRELLEEE